MKFKKGDVVYDMSGKHGIIVAIFKLSAGIFYNVLQDGIILPFPEEDLTKKD